MKYLRVFLFYSRWNDHVHCRVTPPNLNSSILIFRPGLGLRHSQSKISVKMNETKLPQREHELRLVNSESCRTISKWPWWFLHELNILGRGLTTTIASLSTFTAACKGVSPLSSRHLTSAPDLSSNSTILTCLPRIALCSGVLPNESGEFISGEERVVKHLQKLAQLESLGFKFSLHYKGYITLLTVH